MFRTQTGPTRRRGACLWQIALAIPDKIRDSKSVRQGEQKAESPGTILRLCVYVCFQEIVTCQYDNTVSFS